MEQSFMQPTINCLPKIIILFYVPWRLERENNLPRFLFSLLVCRFGLDVAQCTAEWNAFRQTDEILMRNVGKNYRYLLLDSYYYCGVWLVHWNWKRCLTALKVLRQISKGMY
ncbi:hypothetical protein CDAR_415561 [Caerostris darwini]|uniref:Uncharacterized protein n=1 Tax=Caerostris darwini TaxID=1538125 RepID=A0AAV4Q1L4_9ARAC|nr:hypothetical protein CDAR_415561 [Caerostris darwini]